MQVFKLKRYEIRQSRVSQRYYTVRVIHSSENLYKLYIPILVHKLIFVRKNTSKNILLQNEELKM